MGNPTSYGKKVMHFTATTNGVAGNFAVQSFVYSGATTSGHSCALVDGDGDVVFRAQGNAIPTVVCLAKPLMFNRLSVSTLASGRISVYLA